MMNRVKETAAAAAKKARKTFDNMREGMMAPAVAPTPYVDSKGRRINKTNNGAMFTKDAEGNRNYKPVANAVKPPKNNAPMKTITKETAKTVPKEIRPKK
jgi:hypothetical protein